MLSTRLPWDLAQTKWAAELNPFLALPILNGIQINKISLTANKPLAVNHLLDKTPQGWFLVDNTADAVVWRSAPFTKTTVTLTSNVSTTIAIWIY